MSTKRPRKAFVLELLAWFLVAVITAVVLIFLSDSILPANF